MTVDAFAEVKGRIDLLEIAGEYTRMVRHGQEHRGLCPLHSEKTPSFYVSPARQLWHCKGCNEGGDVFTLVEKVERIEPREALERLAERAGVELERSGVGGGGAARAARKRRVLELNTRAAAWFEHVLWNTEAGAPGRTLLAERGLDRERAQQFGVGFAPAGGAAGNALLRYLMAKCGASAEEAADAGLAHPPARGGGSGRDRFRDRLVFPIRDERGGVLAFGGRALGDAQPKYLNSPETAVYSKSRALFGLDLARKAILEVGAVLIVEGYFDVVAAHLAGVHHVVASSGTALTTEQVQHLGRLATTFVLCFDGDRAGQAATVRAVDLIASLGMTARIVELPGEAKDPDEVVQRDPAAFASCVAESRPEWEVLLDRALGGDESGSVEQRRAAQQRVVAMLARVPQVAVRSLYVQKAARRLELEPGDVAQGVEALRRGERPVRPRVTVAADLPVAREAETDEPPPRPWEQTLGALIVQAPDLATRLVGEFGLVVEEVRHEGVRRIVERALAGREVMGEGQRDQRLAARLGVMSRPELDPIADPDGLDQALRDVVRCVAERAILTRMERVRNDLRRARDEGRVEEAQALASEYSKLAVQAPLLRRTMARR